MNNPFVIGVTGLFGAGKTTFCRFLEEFGITWIHTDKITHDLYEVGGAGYRKIKEYFGEKFLIKAGVNRKKLRKVILNDPQKLWILNRLIHPLVAEEVNKKIVQKGRNAKRFEGGKEIFCIEAVYFEENDLGKMIDYLVQIAAPEAAILGRVSERDISIDEVRKFLRIGAGIPRKPDIIIQNSGGLEDFRKSAEEFANDVQSRTNI